MATDQQALKLITVPEGKICDYIDNTFRSDTPEEYVRQNIEKRMVNELKYPKDRIKVEHTIKVGDAKKRVDLAIFEKDTAHTQENIRVIIECKKESVEPRNIKEGIGQLQAYMAASVNCEWGLWTNGKNRMVYRKIQVDGKWEFQEFNDIPDASGSVDDVERPKRGKLKSAVEDNLLFVFKTCHNHIYAVDGLKKEDAFFELLKVIFCKIADERNIPNPLEFYTTSSERSNPDGQLVVKNRIGNIFEQVKRKFSQIFPANATIELKPRSLAWVVSELQGYMRQWILEQARVVASIDLHCDTFQPWTGVQTSIVILQKKTKEERQEEMRTGQMRPYNIFMAMIERVGHDKRGNTIFKRDIHGNEILVPEQQNVVELGRTADGTATAKTQSLQKVADDQSVYVPKVFAEWKQREGITW